jgi:condensin complex subunit 1
MHGGELSMSEWSARYDGLAKELEVLDLPSAEEAEARAAAEEMMKDVEEDVIKEENDEEEEAVEEQEEEEEEEDDEDMEDVPKKRRKAQEPLKKKASRKSDGIDLAAADQSQLLAVVDAETLTRLRLTKKYYADAIAFIEQLDRAMPTIADLIASTVKSEVLEAMDFFKVAYEYKIDSADVRLHSIQRWYWYYNDWFPITTITQLGVKRMLHLIWSKDEATTEEDGKEVKGIRSRLIECYTQLYFEPVADISAKDQVSRVAQNVIEWVFFFFLLSYLPHSESESILLDLEVIRLRMENTSWQFFDRLTNDATLAELTSLEQLLGVMMAKGVVSDDVITKLWQVYSKFLLALTLGSGW